MKLLALISGGIDSPVASHLFLEKGADLSAVIFNNEPFSTNEELESAFESVKKLSKAHEKRINSYLVPHGPVQEKFLNNCEERDLGYSCLFNRRMMFRISQRLAEKNDLRGLVTGDSLGQVASQTLDNLSVIGSVTDLPVYRPLLGFDKSKIIELAKRIGTFEITAGKGISCAVNPDYPETHARIDRMEKIEAGFPLTEMVDERVDQVEQKEIEG